MRIKLVKRDKESLAARIAVPMVSILLALLFGWIFLAVFGYQPEQIYIKMVYHSLGSKYALSETVVKAIPLMVTSLGISVAFRMKLWNIGAEGQIYMGAFAASGIALACGNWPAWILIPFMMLAAFIIGGLWGSIPGTLKAFGQVNETITSLLLNYVAIAWVGYLVFGPWKDPKAAGFPFAPRVSESASLPTFFGTRIHLGILVALMLCGLLFMLFKYSKLGYEIKVIGESRIAAKYAGIKDKRNIVLVMFLSAGIAGIAGMLEVCGVTHRLQQGLSPGYGYTAIIIAWLARLNPFNILLVAFLMAALLVGGFGVQSSGVPLANVTVIQGAILLFLLAGDIFTKYRIEIVRTRK